MHDPQLGELRWDETMKWWIASVDLPTKDKEIGIAAEPNLEQHLTLARTFCSWLPANCESFLDTLTEDLFETECILPEWHIPNPDDLSEEEFEEECEKMMLDLRGKLEIESVNVTEGVLKVWLDTKGYTTDHLVQTHLDREFNIVDMHT